jgi:hypothetical protein
MGYDEGLAVRVRAAVGDRPDITEKQMFGGARFGPPANPVFSLK